jgi:ribosomal-protein-alanine N-acetyltransferase
MTILETQRLTIRNFRVSDWEALHEMISQYESSEVAAYDHQWPTSPEEIRKVAEWFASGDSYLAVCLKDTGQFIGFVSLNEESRNDCRAFNLGHIFNFDHHGKGFATEACRAAVDHVFARLKADTVLTGTAAENRASCRLLERLGLKRTAEDVGSLRNGPDGQPIEFLGYTYAISKAEWEVANKHKAA